MEPLYVVILVLAAAGAALLAWWGYREGRLHSLAAAEELSSINRFGLELLRAKLSMEDLAGLVYERTAEMVPVPWFHIGLFEGDSYAIKVWAKDGQRLDPANFPHEMYRGMADWLRATGQPLLVKDLAAERDTLPFTATLDEVDMPRSGLFVPLLAGGGPIGVLAVQSPEPGRYDEEDLRVITATANLAAAAIRNAQIYEHAEYRAGQLRLIGQVSAKVSAVQPLADLFRQIVTLIQSAFSYYSVTVFLHQGDALATRASTAEGLLNIEWIALGEGMVGWAALQGEPALSNNVADDPRYRSLGVLPATRSELALPLKVEDRVLGVLDVQSDHEDAFTLEDVRLLEMLAAQIALAIEQAQTYDAEHSLAQQLEALVQVGQAITSVLDLDDLLDRLVDLVAEVFGYERVHIFVRLGNVLVFRAGIGPHSVRWLIDELTYDLDTPGLIPRAARTGEPVIASDVSQSADYQPGKGLEDTQSELVVPIKMADRVLGVLDIQSEQRDAFSEADMRLVQALADSAAVAVRNAALYANERRRRDLADALREASQTLASELEIDEVVAETLEGMRRVTSLATAAVMLFDPAGDYLTIYATTGEQLAGYFGHRVSLAERLPEGGELGEDFARELYADLFGERSDGNVLIVPLTVGGYRIGYVVAEQLFPWLQTDEALEMVVAFANQAAIAISNARLYAAQQAETYVTTVLLQVAEAVNSQLDTQQALETIARLTALLAGVSRCVILRWDEDDRAYTCLAQYGIAREAFEEQAALPMAAADYPLLDLMSVSDRPLAAGDGHQLTIPTPLNDLLPASAIRCVPLRARSGPIGLLVVDDPHPAGNSRLMAILAGIAHQTATVLETAHLQASVIERRRLEQELEVARSIQASFIPDHPPEVPGWEIAAAWRAARQVSGDFYDFIPLQNGLWGVLIADVADKGTPAALFMAVCRTLLRAAAASRLSPSETLRRTNELLFNDARTDLFVTVFYAVWNPANGRVTYASGGHNEPLLLRAGEDHVVRLTAQGIALGVIPEIELEEGSLTLEPGDVLVAYTDGVTEAMQVDYTEWGLERFQRTLLSVQGSSAQMVLGGVLEAVGKFVGDAPQSDDLTMWVLRRAQPE